MKNSSRKQWLWAVAAGLTGWLASAVFSNWLQWSRAAFVSGYGVLVSIFVTLYVRTSGAGLRTQVRRHWVRGIFGGLTLGLLLVWTVSIQPRSGRPGGLDLVGALVWYGVVYGGADAFLLNVLPVLSIYGSRPQDVPPHGAKRFGWGLVSLAGSLLVTAIYHLGFREYWGPSLIGPLLGNGIITLGYLLTGNPLASILSHIIMHGAAVMHGMETTGQLPPHYGP